MSKENRVSDVRLTLIASGIADRLGAGAYGAPDLERDIASAITELLALRSKPVAGVEVKPLGDWRKVALFDLNDLHVPDYEGIATKVAESIVGTYAVVKVDGGKYAPWLGKSRLPCSFETDDEATAAAEADYRRRIFSTLPLPAQEPVAWRREYADPHYQSEVTQWKETADVWVEDGFTVTPLYASPQPEAVITDEMVERAAKKFVAHQNGQSLDEYGDGSYSRGIKHSMRLALTAALKDGN